MTHSVAARISGVVRSTWGLGLATIGVLAMTTGCACSNDLLVLSAASAQDGIRAIANQDADSSVPRVAVASGGSNALVRQLGSGARGDVLITADARNMSDAIDQGLVAGEPVTFAQSTLVLAVSASSGSVNGLADLSKTGVTLVICAPEVPCGDAAAEVLTDRKINADVRSWEPNSRQALAKVSLGEADAALVWAVDVAQDNRVRAIPLPSNRSTTNYQAAVTQHASNSAEANAFVTALLSSRSQATLADLGFQGPQ
jgi:molybdate transport system substrate-binding protein